MFVFFIYCGLIRSARRHVLFRAYSRNFLTIGGPHLNYLCSDRLHNEIHKITVSFLLLSLPVHNRLSDEALLAETTVMIQSFRTDRSGQTVQTQTRLLLEEQSDQGLHCLLFHLHLFDKKSRRFGLFS